MNTNQVGYKLARLKRKRELYAKRHRGVNENLFDENLTRMDGEYQLLSESHSSGLRVFEEAQTYRSMRGSSRGSNKARVSHSNRGSSSPRRSLGRGGRNIINPENRSYGIEDEQEIVGDNITNQSPSAMPHAAEVVNGGRTSHLRFNIPFDLGETSGCPINVNTDLAKLIQEASLIIWDDAPMMHQHGFEAVSKTLQDLLKENENFSTDKPFGGKLCVLGGDFKQILSVVTKGSREAIVAASLHKSKLWNQCRLMRLKINMRLIARDGSTQLVDDLRNFAERIYNIGEGKEKCLHFDDGVESDWVELPEDLLIENGDNPFLQLINTTYPELSNRYRDPTYLKGRAILAPKNSNVDDINSTILSMLPGEVRQFCSADTLCPGETTDHEQNMNPSELLNSIKISGIPNHCLELKEGPL